MAPSATAINTLVMSLIIFQYTCKINEREITTHQNIKIRAGMQRPCIL